MANLPTETMEEILVKLPVKDLLRFKCVCKDWLSLITSQRFINRHHKSKQPCQLLRLCPISGDDEKKYFYCFYPMYDDNGRFLQFEEVNFHPHLPFCNNLIADLNGVMRPINGIFCLRFVSGDLALSNPAIRELRPLPRGTFKYEFGYRYQYALGFGCDLSCGSLKVVALFQEFQDRSPKTAFVYNSITDSWKTIEIQVTYLRIRSDLHHAFVNGVYYWFVDYDKTTFGILAFDMRSEIFHQIKIPDYVRGSLSMLLRLRIVEHDNSMALHLQKCSDCRHGFTRNIDDTHGFNRNRCVGEMWQLGGRSMALDLCTLLGGQKSVGELWVMKREGYWCRTRMVEAEWILPWQWVKTDKDGVVELSVVSDNVYKESLVSIKREGEGEDDIGAFLYPCLQTGHTIYALEISDAGEDHANPSIHLQSSGPVAYLGFFRNVEASQVRDGSNSSTIPNVQSPDQEPSLSDSKPDLGGPRAERTCPR